MKQTFYLNAEQKALVEENLQLVKKAVFKYINSTGKCGLDYEDLFQEGCVWLCKAAATFKTCYNVKFSTYADHVVKNGICTYCRLAYQKQKRISYIPDYDQLKYADFPVAFTAADRLDDYDVICLLHSLKRQYSGVARLGIEALEWKIKGLSGTQIADIYGVKPNAVGAWISRAVKKLKQNAVFISWVEQLGKQDLLKKRGKI